LEQANQGSENADSNLDRGGGSANPQRQKLALFIPITWLRKREREYYSGSDPEWQQFAALSKDRDRVKAIKSRLSDHICRQVANDQRLTRAIGKPLTVSAAWLEFHFPSMAPVEYERSGILWFDNKMTWATRVFDERQTMRLYRVFIPKALFSSIQTLSSNLIASHYASLKGLWSSQGKPEHQKTIDKPAAGPPAPATRQDESKGAPAISVPKRLSTSQQNLSSTATPILQAEAVRHIMPDPEPGSAISVAAKAFKLNFLKEWRQSQFGRPRGVCLLEGEIGLQGPKGRCKMSVSAIYLPKDDVFVEIIGASTGVWQHSQAPLGKPKPGRPSRP
jgi:hypothetical protein